MNKSIIEGIIDENILEGMEKAYVYDKSREIDLDDELLTYKGKKVRIIIEILE